MYRAFRAEADFAVVYIAEAHPVDGWQTASNEAEGIRIRQAVTFADRLAAAERCAAALALSIPTLVDGMDDAARQAFAAWPERIFLVGRDNRVAYRGGPGPYGFDPAEARRALLHLLRPEA
jgi:type I thyroxine 5'-deiodinase